jgi:hypothetical protein
MTGYKYANRDILSFRRAIDDIGNSCRNNDIEFFELSNLAIVVRHIAILGCYLIGKPDFSRYTAVKVCCASLCPEVMLPKTFPRLYDYRLFADGRGKKPDGVEAAQLWQWLKDAEALLRAVEDASNGYRNPMH